MKKPDPKQQRREQVSAALPPPQQRLSRLQKEQAFQTLAGAGEDVLSQAGDLPLTDETGVKEARDWVNYDQL